MPIKKIVTVYPFAELSEKAKEKVMNDYQEACGYDHARWAVEWIAEEIAAVGLKLTAWDAYHGTATVTPHDTTSRVILKDIAAYDGGHVLDEHKAACSALLAKMDRLERVDRLYYATKHRESQTTHKALGELYFNLEAEIEDEKEDLWIKMGRTVGRLIKEEVEYTESEEYMAEHFEINEYLFFQHGELAPRDLPDAVPAPSPETIAG